MSHNRKETVSAVNLTTGYRGAKGSKVITRGINASLFAGELTCLLGPNGAGKSTLLRTLTAFLPPLEGEVIVEGEPLTSYSGPRLARIIGVVLTEKPQVSNMTVAELVMLGRSPYTGFWGNPGADDRRIVDDAMALVGITELSGRNVASLSDGERQKAMIAKALAQHTPVIFLDEPTAFLDYPSKVEIMQLLRRLAREQGITVFMSTHDLELALQSTDRVWLIDRRLGVTTGTPEDLALNGELSRYFTREGVKFDTGSGLFVIDHPLRHRIRLEGSGAEAAMVSRALARNGIGADPAATDIIEASPAGYTLNGLSCADIDALLEAVDQLFAE